MTFCNAASTLNNMTLKPNNGSTAVQYYESQSKSVLRQASSLLKEMASSGPSRISSDLNTSASDSTSIADGKGRSVDESALEAAVKETQESLPGLCPDVDFGSGNSGNPGSGSGGNSGNSGDSGNSGYDNSGPATRDWELGDRQPNSLL